MVRLILLISALLPLTGCERKDRGAPSKGAVVGPELKVNLKEQIGRDVEVTGLLVGVSADAAKEQDQWVGETTATLECKGLTLTCRFPRATKVPVQFVPGVADARLLTVRGTVASVEPEGTATLVDCVVVSDPHKP